MPYGFNKRLRNNVKRSGVGGGKMVRDKNRPGMLKRALGNAKKVIRQMKA